MKYLTLDELNNLRSLLEYLNGTVSDDLGVDVNVYDVNGESVGTINRSGAEYVFYPSQEAE